MASSINADNGVVSGSSGLKSTADTSGVLALQSNGTTALSVGTDLNVTLTNPLPVTSGGTGATSLSGITTGTATNLAGGSNGTIPYQSASGTTQMLAAGTSGQVLTSNGAAAPTWATPAPGAGTVTATASGSLSDGSAVILNSNGTVSVVTASAAANFTVGNQAQYSLGGSTSSTCASFSSTDSKIIVFYRWTNDYLYAVLGTVSGSTITFGTPTTVVSQQISVSNNVSPKTVYMPNANRHMCIFMDYGNNYMQYVVCSSSGSTAGVTTSGYITFSAVYQTTISYDTVQNAAFIGYTLASTAYKKAVCVPVASNGSVTVGADTNFDTSGYNGATASGYDPVSGKCVVAYIGNSNYTYAKVATLDSATASVSFGSEATVLSSYNGNPLGVGPHAASGKVIVVYAPSQLAVKVGTISGTSISFGTQSNAFGGASYTPYGVINIALNSTTFITNGGYMYEVTVSGTTPTVSTSAQYTYSPSSQTYPSFMYDSNVGQIINTWYYSSNLNAATADNVTTNLTSTNFLGFSNAAYTNGQTATIQTVGSTDDAQSGLTPGLKYYVAKNGGLSSSAPTQPYAGVALTTTTLVVKG